MTVRQRFLRLTYPIWRWLGGLLGQAFTTGSNRITGKSIHHLAITLGDGTRFPFSDVKGKKMLLVNTASDCGYTSQLASLQKFHERYGDRVTVIGFPSNDFKQQETGTDAEISVFCRTNFGVNFMLAKKGIVIKSAEQQEIYRWLSDKQLNGWNNRAPVWNFCKYILNEQGELTHIMGPAIHPNGKQIKKALGIIG